MISKKLPLVIYGASGHALVVADIIRLQAIFEIVGFIDDINLERHGNEFCGAPILGGSEYLEQLSHLGVHHIALGFGDCAARLELTRTLLDRGFSLPVVVHPYAVVAQDVLLGSGTLIAAGVVINPGVKVGTGVIINTSASVDHECTLGDAAHIGPGVHLAGLVTVGKATQLGVGTIVRDRVKIGARSIVGAGSVVLEDIPDNVVAYGVPATVKRMASR